jgi:hypothetical protein
VNGERQEQGKSKARARDKTFIGELKFPLPQKETAMKRQIWMTLMVLALAAPAVAMDQGKMKGDMKGMEMKGGMKGMEMKGGMKMDQMGEQIHTSKVDDYQLAYHLIDMKEKMAAMKGMKGMSMQGMDMSKMGSHHLMLRIAKADGTNITEGKVGFKVTGPDGAEQKIMAMAMKGAFGADVDFKAKGTYTIQAKAVAGDATLVDEFTYEAK